MSAETSSSTSTNIQASSATNTSQQEVYYKQFIAPKPQTVAQIKASGDVKTRIGVLWFVGIICVALIGIGGISLIKDPTSAKDVWVIIGPIISSAVTGTVAFFTGEKQGSQK
ncbi:hypothetical protein V7114_20650 [Neobacillus niacini]|uniref:hypothetical protein n=1 Tax=Neobacillus niacini TaxID=86668 RepID=UPI0030009C89